MTDVLFGALLVAGGFLMIIGAHQGWSFLPTRSAKLIMSMFGEEGGRVYHFILGTVLAVVGMSMFFRGLMSF